jgi:hypothetical protein
MFRRMLLALLAIGSASCHGVLPLGTRATDSGIPDPPAVVPPTIADGAPLPLPQANLKLGDPSPKADLIPISLDAGVKPDTTVANLNTCADGVNQILIIDKLVLCMSSYASFNQLEAEKGLCGPTYHLCTMTEYAQQGGGTKAVFLAPPAWLSGCVRDGPQPLSSPKDAVCSSASLALSSLEVVSTDCSGKLPQVTQRHHVGVATSLNCNALPELGGRSGFWRYLPSDTPLNAALCCK